jgi:outer membrane protein OmpA-like peptidoglycan-associated protein
MFRKSVVLFALLTSLSAWAIDGNILRFKPEVQRGDIYQPKGFWPLLGVGLGITDANSNVRSGGVPMHLKLVGSYYFETAPWVADLGVGFHNEVLTQSGRDSDTIQSFYTEVAGRYVFTNRWQLGAVWNTLVDNPDRYHSNTDNLASFVGVQAFKEMTWSNEYLVRLGGRAMTDVGISGASVDTIMAELEVSFGGPNNPPVVKEEPQPQPVAAPVAPHLADRAVQTFEINPDTVKFDTNSTHVVKNSDAYLKHLARALAANRHLFDKVEVVGHADQRGTDKYNNKLSVRRAHAISDKLVAAGVSRQQIVSVGKGRKEPVTHAMTASGLQKNRRVELEFQGVKNQEALKNVIDSVKE